MLKFRLAQYFGELCVEGPDSDTRLLLINKTEMVLRKTVGWSRQRFFQRFVIEQGTKTYPTADADYLRQDDDEL